MKNIYLKENLEFLKIVKDVTDEKVGEETGLGKTFRNYVVGKNKPPLESLVLIAKYFKVSIDDLLLVDMKHRAIEHITVEDQQEKYTIEKKLEKMDEQIREIIKKIDDKKSAK